MGLARRCGRVVARAGPEDDLLFFAGCSEEQIELPFDLRVVLTVPEDELMARLRTRTSNAYGRTPAERSQVLADLADVEPLLRRPPTWS